MASKKDKGLPMTSSSSLLTEPQQPEKLKCLNYANALAYVLNAGLVYFVGLSGVSFASNADISAKYQTIVTPAPYTFGIWALIFIAQFIWAIAQLLPSLRSKDAVLKGVSFYYLLVCAAQVAWSFLFVTEKIIISLVAISLILLPLVIISVNFNKIHNETTLQYWLLKFPFEVHTGWVLGATLVNANVVLVYLEQIPSIQIMSAWTTLCTLYAFGFVFAYHKVYVVPLVVAWACIGIAVELTPGIGGDGPLESITENFSQKEIQAVQIVSAGVAAASIVTIFAGLSYRRYQNRQQTAVAQQEVDKSSRYSSL